MYLDIGIDKIFGVKKFDTKFKDLVKKDEVLFWRNLEERVSDTDILFVSVSIRKNFQTHT